MPVVYEENRAVPSTLISVKCCEWIFEEAPESPRVEVIEPRQEKKVDGIRM
jgi:hypothetical protein